MLSVGLCLSARLPAGLLVFFGFVGSFGSIDHRLQQFELLPCGAVQTVDFFRSHSWRGRLRPVFRVRPIPLSFWGNVPPLQWGHSFAWLTHLRLHRYHLIFTGYWLSAIRSRSLSEVGRCRDNRVSYFRAKVYGLVVQVTHPLSPCIVYNSPKKQKIPPEEQNLRFALRRDVFRHDCYKFKKDS